MLSLQVIKAEIRRNVKNKRLLIMIITFLCFFTFVYGSAISTMNRKQYDEKLSIPFIFNVSQQKATQLEFEIQHTPADQERPGLRQEFELWMALLDNYKTWTYEHTQLSYYGWENATKAIHDFNQLLYEGFETKVYQDEFKSQGYTKQVAKANMDYYRYFLDHNIQPYTNDSQPNFANFITLLLRDNAFFLFLIIGCIFTIQLISYDYDSSTYKIQFSAPISRNKFVMSKIIASFSLLLIAFLIALVLFAALPISQYGLGNFQYPYLIDNQMATYATTTVLAIVLAIAVLALYLAIAYLITIFLSQFSNALIAIGSLMVIVYFLIRLLGTTQFFAFIPLFYITPFTIAMNAYPLHYGICLLLTIAATLLILTLCAYQMKRKDLKGSELS